MKLILVRHGATDFNELGLMQGSSDITLNKKGIKQANLVKEKLKDIEFTICISSPLKRTLQTAQIIVNNKCNIIYDDLIIERGLGKLEGKSHKTYKKYDYWNYKKNEDANGVESLKRLFERTSRFLEKIKKNYEDNDTILIVSHSATIRALHYNIIGYDENTDFLKFKSENCSIYEYEIY